MQFTHEVCRAAEVPWRDVWQEWTEVSCLPRLLTHVRGAVAGAHEDLARLTILLDGRYVEFAAERTMCADQTLCWQSQGELFFYVLSLRVETARDGQTLLTLSVAYDPPGFLPDIAETLGRSRRFARTLEADLDRYVQMLHQNCVSELTV